MTSTATKAQSSSLRISTADGTGEAIIAITAADPPVATSTAHGFNDGDIIQIAGIVGMVELNGRAFVVDNKSVNDFELKGVKAAGYTAYVSGGTATPKTMGLIGNVVDFDIQPDAAADIPLSNLASVRQEYTVGLAGSWTMTCQIQIDPTDTGQDELNDAQDDLQSRVFTITLSSGSVFAGVGYVKSLSASGSTDSIVSGSLTVRGTGQPTWFA